MAIDREKRFLYNSKGVDTKLQIGYPSKTSTPASLVFLY